MSDQTTIKPGTKVGKQDTIRGFTEGPGGDELQTLKKSEVYQKIGAPPAGATVPPETLRCRTQKPAPPNLKTSADVLKIWVGLFVNITRWKKGSVVNFATLQNGYPSRDLAIYSANALNDAAEIWNSKDVGVTFAWVDKVEDANFVLTYGGRDGNTVASAYFPTEDDLSNVYVYARAFDPDTKPFLTNFFLHELGHVLGLRHEFAMDIDPDTGRVKEGGAVQIGIRNEFSVMNYRRDPPKIQDSDVIDTKKFYDLTTNKIGNLPLLTYVPDN